MRLEVSHTHLHPGCRVRMADAPAPAHAPDGLVEFSDGVVVPGRLARRDGTRVRHVPAYRTARGADVEAKSWQLRPDDDGTGWRVEQRLSGARTRRSDDGPFSFLRSPSRDEPLCPPHPLPDSDPMNASVPDPDPRPQPPEPPLASDCCDSGCDPCVNDTYAEELAYYRQALAAWLARHPEAAG